VTCSNSSVGEKNSEFYQMGDGLILWLKKGKSYEFQRYCVSENEFQVYIYRR
jgi:hypothetical protein